MVQVIEADTFNEYNETEGLENITIVQCQQATFTILKTQNRENIITSYDVLPPTKNQPFMENCLEDEKFQHLDDLETVEKESYLNVSKLHILENIDCFKSQSDQTNSVFKFLSSPIYSTNCGNSGICFTFEYEFHNNSGNELSILSSVNPVENCVLPEAENTDSFKATSKTSSIIDSPATKPNADDITEYR